MDKARKKLWQAVDIIAMGLEPLPMRVQAAGVAKNDIEDTVLPEYLKEKFVRLRENINSPRASLFTEKESEQLAEEILEVYTDAHFPEWRRD